MNVEGYSLRKLFMLNTLFELTVTLLVQWIPEYERTFDSVTLNLSKIEILVEQFVNFSV